MDRTSSSDKKVLDFYENYFSAFLKAFPDILHVHFGILPQEEHGFLPMRKRLEGGMERLLEDVAVFSGLERKESPITGLDLGCGLGGTSIYLAKKLSFFMVGITIAPSQITSAIRNVRKQKLENQVRIQYGDGRQLHFADNVFDFVIMIEVAFHVLEKDRLFQEIYRVLKPNGRLIMADIEAAHYDPLMEAFGVHCFLPVDGYRQLSDAVGFDHYREKDISREICFWMRDYVKVSGSFFQFAVFVRLLAGLHLVRACNVLRSRRYMRNMLRRNLDRIGLDPKNVRALSSQRRIRREFMKFLEEGALVYKIIEQQK